MLTLTIFSIVYLGVGALFSATLYYMFCTPSEREYMANSMPDPEMASILRSTSRITITMHIAAWLIAILWPLPLIRDILKAVRK